jgi:IS30 family transposase
MNKLTKTEKYAVLYLHSQNKSVEEIAKELKILNKSLIEKELIRNKQKDKSSPLPIKQSKVTSKDLMIRNTRDKGINNVAIMTKEASMKNDSLRQTDTSSSSSKYIHKIK